MLRPCIEMEYLVVKFLHIISSTVLFGTGLGTAYFMWRANLSGDVTAMAHTSKWVVKADWVFTTPAVVLQPLTGIVLMQMVGLPFTPWIIYSLVLYALAGLCWLPVVWLQMRMRDLAETALCDSLPIAPVYARYARIWFWLGVPAFTAMVLIFFLMVTKPV